jgi:hypothetical protein
MDRTGYDDDAGSWFGSQMRRPNVESLSFKSIRFGAGQENILFYITVNGFIFLLYRRRKTSEQNSWTQKNASSLPVDTKREWTKSHTETFFLFVMMNDLMLLSEI